ncbi:MAG: EAL domain-containing protein [Alphaproteobacteria bacterium]|nr:EAL domain-containing protein [Alphaproteobacteria bacterium]
MSKQDTPYVAAIVGAIALALGSGGYMLAGGAAPLVAMVMAVAFLGIGQAILTVWNARRAMQNTEEHLEIFAGLSTSQKAFKEQRGQLETLNSRLEETRSEVSRDRATVSHGFSELKQSYASLLASMQRTTKPVAPQEAAPFAQPVHVVQSAEPQFTPPPTETAPFAGQMAVSLEPIIDLSTGRTAHYRMHLALADSDGQDMASELFLHHAERIGARPALDVFVAREAEILLRKLRLRDPQLNIFMPIGASTLSSPETISKINDIRQLASDVSAGLMFEFPHTMLAGLSELALEGLASLARKGACFALSNVSIAGLDLQAMNTLNVRFVSIDAAAIDPVHGPTLAMASFTQTARASRVQMIVSNVNDARIISKLPHITRLVSGSSFATPRRVKKDVLETAANDFNVAA